MALDVALFETTVTVYMENVFFFFFASLTQSAERDSSVSSRFMLLKWSPLEGTDGSHGSLWSFKTVYSK